MAEEGLGTASRVGEFKHIMNELTPSGVEIITECNKDTRKHWKWRSPEDGCKDEKKCCVS
jgi:hypothetical protein